MYYGVQERANCVLRGARKSQLRLDEVVPCALTYGSGEGKGDQKGMRRGGEGACEPCVMCMRPMATGLQSVLMLIRRAAAFAKLSHFPLNAYLVSWEEQLVDAAWIGWGYVWKSPADSRQGRENHCWTYEEPGCLTYDRDGMPHEILLDLALAWHRLACAVRGSWLFV